MIQVQDSLAHATRRREQERLVYEEDHGPCSHEEHILRRGNGPQVIELAMRNRDFAVSFSSSHLIDILHLRNVRADTDAEARREITRFLDRVQAHLPHRGPGRLHPSVWRDNTDETHERLRVWTEEQGRARGLEGEWDHGFYNRLTFRKSWAKPTYDLKFTEDGTTELVTGLGH